MKERPTVIIRLAESVRGVVVEVEVEVSVGETAAQRTDQFWRNELCFVLVG